MGLPAIESSGRSQDTEALYREHGTAVARFCRSLLRDRTEAEDATQQVFLSAHRALLNGSTPREPLAWLLTVARHECQARYRQRAVTPLPTGDVPDATTPDAAAHALRGGEIASVWDEVRKMPPAQREAFLLREIRGLSYGQLADELSLSPPSVRSLLVRARRRLRHRLRDVTAGFGGVQWIQSLVRLASGDGGSPVPAATKAAAVGIGAVALVGGGGHLAHVSPRASTPRGPAAVRQWAPGHVHRAAKPARFSIAPDTAHPTRHVERPSRNASQGSGSGSRRNSADVDTSSGGSSPESGHDGSDETTAVAQPPSDGSGDTSGRDGSGDRSSGLSSGSDDGAGSTTTTATSSGSDDSGSGDSGSEDSSSGDSGSGGGVVDGGHDGGG